MPERSVVLNALGRSGEHVVKALRTVFEGVEVVGILDVPERGAHVLPPCDLQDLGPRHIALPVGECQEQAWLCLLNGSPYRVARLGSFLEERQPMAQLLASGPQQVVQERTAKGQDLHCVVCLLREYRTAGSSAGGRSPRTGVLGEGLLTEP